MKRILTIALIVPLLLVTACNTNNNKLDNYNERFIITRDTIVGEESNCTRNIIFDFNNDYIIHTYETICETINLHDTTKTIIDKNYMHNVLLSNYRISLEYYNKWESLMWIRFNYSEDIETKYNELRDGLSSTNYDNGQGG